MLWPGKENQWQTAVLMHAILDANMAYSQKYHVKLCSNILVFQLDVCFGLET